MYLIYLPFIVRVPCPENGRHDTQYDTAHQNDIWHHDTQHNNETHGTVLIALYFLLNLLLGP
jgi:hypothetical protein